MNGWLGVHYGLFRFPTDEGDKSNHAKGLLGREAPARHNTRVSAAQITQLDKHAVNPCPHWCFGQKANVSHVVDPEAGKVNGIPF